MLKKLIFLHIFTISSLVFMSASCAGQIEDSQTEDKQDLENPRIAVQENLEEMYEVKTVTKEKNLSESRIEADKTPAQAPKSESPDNPMLRNSDKVLEVARLPLTYVQEHVPYFTKRNIIFFGRLELDGAIYSGILDQDSGFDIRRFRLGIAGLFRFWPGWNYKLEIDLTDGQNSLADVYLSRYSKKWGRIRIGNQKVAQTLSGQTSSLSTTFMERPLPVLAFTLDRRTGIGWDTHLRRLGANVTVFAGDPNRNIGSQGWAARGYFNPTRDRFQVLHIGASFLQLSTDDDARLRARPESGITSTRFVDTGIRPDVDSVSAIGLELAGSRKSVTFKSEMYFTEWSRPDPLKNPRFQGWYAEVSWFLTGELAHYRNGKFIRPNILSENGAWEVAFRASSIDLNDVDVHGGVERNLAVAVNWYSKTHWRFMSNLIKVRATDGPFGKQEPWIAQFRMQYYF